MKKVYCKNCKYWSGYKECHEPESKSIYHDWHGTCFVYKECSLKNKNNDCPDYKRKWWKWWIK